ncbi:MAG: COX15/CtaA family protein [Cellvibrionales bacterium]|nr:COX15/CtaA family protein [Cellvibrionales bacterium]
MSFFQHFLHNPRPGFALALGTLIFTFFVVGLGAFTRLVDAGLGCPDWPGCYGHLLWPNQPDEIAAANRAFPDMPVIAGKAWPEMLHRYAAGLLGLLILALAAVAVWQRKVLGYPFRLPLFLLLLVVWQALFGMWTVTLKLWPQVVTIHLLGGFATLVLLSVLVQRLSTYRWQLNAPVQTRLRRLRPWMFGGIALVAVQVGLGGWLAANYAAFGCPPGEFPACHGSFWPPMDFAQGFNIAQRIGPNYLGGLMDSEARTAIHYAHRAGALAVTLYLLGLAVACLRLNYPPLNSLTHALLAALALQLMLGIGNILLLVPLWLAVAHNLAGALLLALLAALAVQSMQARLEE